jgi:hypothetical protein
MAVPGIYGRAVNLKRSSPFPLQAGSGAGVLLLSNVKIQSRERGSQNCVAKAMLAPGYTASPESGSVALFSTWAMGTNASVGP